MRHDCLEPLGLSVTEAAKRLGVSPQAVVRYRQWPCGHLAGDGDPLRQGFRRRRRHVVPAAGGLRPGPSDEAGRPDQDRATVAGGVGATGRKRGEVCDGGRSEDGSADLDAGRDRSGLGYFAPAGPAAQGAAGEAAVGAASWHAAARGVSGGYNAAGTHERGPVLRVRGMTPGFYVAIVARAFVRGGHLNQMPFNASLQRPTIAERLRSRLPTATTTVPPAPPTLA